MFPLPERRVNNLVRTADGVGYRHRPTQSTFDRPRGWQFDKYGKQAGIVYLKMKNPQTGDRLDIGWMRKNGDLKSVVQIRLDHWAEKDGAQNVSPLKMITLRNRTALFASRISHDSQGKKFWETSYFFEATESEEQSAKNEKPLLNHRSWLITIRTDSTHGPVDALALSMANHLKWTVGPKGFDSGQ